MISILQWSYLAFSNFPSSSRDSLLGSDAAQLPRVQEEAVEDDRSCSGLRRGRLPPAVQRRLRDAPQGDFKAAYMFNI